MRFAALHLISFYFSNFLPYSKTDSETYAQSGNTSGVFEKQDWTENGADSQVSSQMGSVRSAAFSESGHARLSRPPQCGTKAPAPRAGGSGGQRRLPAAAALRPGFGAGWGNVGRAFRGPVCLSQEVLSQESPRQSLVKLRLETREQTIPRLPGAAGEWGGGLEQMGTESSQPPPLPRPHSAGGSFSFGFGAARAAAAVPAVSHPRGADWAAVPVMRGGSGSRGGEPGAGSVGGTCTVAVAPALAVAVAPAPAAPVPAGRGTASSKWTRGHSRIAAAPGPRQLPHVPGGQVAGSGQGGLCPRWLCG